MDRDPDLHDPVNVALHSPRISAPATPSNLSVAPQCIYISIMPSHETNTAMLGNRKRSSLSPALRADAGLDELLEDFWCGACVDAVHEVEELCGGGPGLMKQAGKVSERHPTHPPRSPLW